jgi:hypothetical protein
MPYKDQTLCYRTIAGTRYVNWCDVLGDEERVILAGVKARKLPHRVVRHKDGFESLFVREDVPASIVTEIVDEAIPASSL